MRSQNPRRAEEDSGKIRQHVRDVIDGKWVILVMTAEPATATATFLALLAERLTMRRTASPTVNCIAGR